MHWLGVSVMMAYIFVFYTRLPEYIPARLHLPLIMFVLALLYLLATAAILRAFRSRQALLFSAFAAWGLAASAFGLNRGESLGLMTVSYGVSFVCFLGITGLVGNAYELRRIFGAIAAGGGALAFLAIFGGEQDAGRLQVSGGSGTLANANDTALYLVFGLPFCALVASDPRRSKVLRAFAGLGLAGVLYATLRTGSRMGLVGLIVFGVMFLLRGSLQRAVMISLLVLLGGAIATVVLPGGAMARYRTFLETKDEILGDVKDSGDSQEEDVEAQVGWAQGSTQQRRRAAMAGLRLTARHPLFGVGPGQFGYANDLEGNKAVRWMQPHNTYLQLSSETGLPGAILYLWAVFYSLSACYKLYKATKRRPELAMHSRAAYCLLTAFVTLAVTTLFTHISYGFMFPLLCGMTVVLERMSKLEPALAPGSRTSAPQPQMPLRREYRPR